MVKARLNINFIDVFGGEPTPAIEEILHLTDWPPSNYSSYIPIETASLRLLKCHAIWLSYREAAMDSSLLGKSTILAAALAHGVLPVFSHDATGFMADGESLPFWYTKERPPPPAGTVAASAAREANYSWYHRHSSAEINARDLAQSLLLKIP
jgi:hypothetical protein